MSLRRSDAFNTKGMMMKKNNCLPVLTLLVCTLLTGCGTPQFAVTQADDRFTENKNPVFVSENNRISTKSIAGGTHLDNRGVFVNPFVEKDKTANQIVRLGFNVVNKTDYSTNYGGINKLGLPQEIVFRLDDGQLITSKISHAEIASPGIATFNTVTRSASVEQEERGVAPISKANLEKLIAAKSISCKIVGTYQTAVYEEGDVSPSFLDNLRQFHQDYVK